MVKPLEIELRTYDRERARLEDEHRGKFVLIRGAEIAGIFDDFQTASQHAAQRFKRDSYLIHCVATEMMHIPSVLLDGLAAMQMHARMPASAWRVPDEPAPLKQAKTGRCRSRFGAIPPAPP